MRIFLGLTEVSGFFSRLKLGLDELGIPCEYMMLQKHRFAYDGGAAPPSIGQRLIEACMTGRLRGRNRGTRLSYFAWTGAMGICRLILLLWVIARFDVIVLGAGSSFFAFRELPLLRLFGKKVVYTLHGTDARPPYIDGFFDPAEYGLASLEGVTMQDHHRMLAQAHAIVTRKRAQAVRTIERYASFVLCAPGYSHFLTRPYVNFYAVGLPTVAPRGLAPASHITDGQVRILHAPSQIIGKGTAGIRAAIEALIAEGLPIEYIEISGQPNAAVFNALQHCDFVVDQLYSDTPLASFPAEAALLGKPAIVGSYYCDRGPVDITFDHLPPSLWCHPEAIQDAIRLLVIDPTKRETLGRAAHAFVTARWTPSAVAGNLVRVLEGRADNWLIDPVNVENLTGIGLPEQVVREQVAAVIDYEGVPALGLSHNPALERRYLEFSGRS
jgi:glycosyltransferase involved in cell wall biosynthesis